VVRAVLPSLEVDMRHTLLVLALALLWQAPAHAQQRVGRALALEDYYSVKSVGSPRISPNGQWVAYTVSTPVEETNGNVVETWLVRADGSGQPTRVQHQGQDVTNPRWRDDGRLLFTAQDV